MKIEPTHSVSYKMGFRKQFESGEVDYWYTPETYIHMKHIDVLRANGRSRFALLTDTVPLQVDKETKEVKVDEGVLNLMIDSRGHWPK